MKSWTQKGILICALVGLLVGSISGRPADVAPYQAITAYLNAEIESLWLLHKDLERLNRDLNRCLEREVHQAELSEDICDLRFVSDWLADQPSQARRDSLYAAACQAVAALPEAHQAQVRRELRAVHELLAPLPDWLTSLGDYIRREAYRSDKGFATGYRWLDRFTVTYGDFSGLAGKLHFSLAKTWQSTPLNGTPNPYAALLRPLDPVLKHSRDLLRAIRDEDRQGLDQAQAALASAIAQAQTQGRSLLHTLPAQPGSHRDPALRYREVLAQARDLLALAEASLATTALPPDAQAYGWGYYHYNRFLANKFSRPGESLVAQYNRLLLLSPDAGLPQAGEAQVFRTLSPSLPSADLRPAVAVQPTLDQPAPPGHQHLVFLLDVSGSMHRPEKLPLIQRKLTDILTELPAADRASFVTFSGEARVLDEQVPVRASTRIQQSLDALQVGGSSLPETGAQLAYALAQGDTAAGRRQIVLITDGGFAIEGPLLRLIEDQAYTGIPLTILYVGREPEHMQPRLSKLATVGLGQFAHASPQAVAEVLRTTCTGTAPPF